MKRGAIKYRGGWAVLAIDPGGTTGVSEAYVPQRDSLAEALHDAKILASEIKGTHQMQAVQLALKFKAMMYQAQMYRIAPDRLVVPMESFQLRQRNVDLAPVRVQCIFEGLMFNYPVKIVEQTPANAKTFATDDRLRKWGLYERGSEHKRDANRHLALFMARAMA